MFIEKNTTIFLSPLIPKWFRFILKFFRFRHKNTMFLYYHTNINTNYYYCSVLYCRWKILIYCSHIFDIFDYSLQSQSKKSEVMYFWTSTIQKFILKYYCILNNNSFKLQPEFILQIENKLKFNLSLKNRNIVFQWRN